MSPGHRDSLEASLEAGEVPSQHVDIVGTLTAAAGATTPDTITLASAGDFANHDHAQPGDFRRVSEAS